MGNQPNTTSNKDNNILKNVTVVVPTFNEEEAIGDVLDEIIQVGVPKENIIVVDGHSTDRTREIAQSKGVRVILQDGKGKTMAIKSVINYIKTPITLIMDGDYTYPAQHIPELVKEIMKGYDLVIGKRIPEEGAQKSVFSFGNRVLSRTFNFLYGIKLEDVLSGMYAIKTSLLKELSFISRGFGIESEIVAHVASTGGSIKEVPIRYRSRKGVKKLGVRHGFEILVDMIKLAWAYNPVFIIFALGALLLIPGLILGGYVGYHYLVHGIKYYVKGLISVALLTTGLISLLLAILAVYLKRMEIRLLGQMRRLSQMIIRES